MAFTVDAISAGTCSLSVGVVTFNAIGTCTIDANQPGNTVYSAGSQVQQQVTVVKQGQTISFTSTNPSPGAVGGTYTPTASATSGLVVAITIEYTCYGLALWTLLLAVGGAVAGVLYATFHGEDVP